MQLRVRFSDAKTTSTANSCLRLPMRCATTSTQLAIDCDVQRLLRLPMRCATTAIVKINACSRFICVRRRELRLHVYEDKVEIRFQSWSPSKRARKMTGQATSYPNVNLVCDFKLVTVFDQACIRIGDDFIYIGVSERLFGPC